MRKDVMTNDAMAAAALARNIQEMDANLNLRSAAAAGVTSYEDPARFHDLRHALVDEFQPRSLHEQIVTTSVAASLWSQRRYSVFEGGLFDAHILDQWDHAAPGSTAAQRLLQAFQSLTDRERTSLRTLLGLHDRLQHSSRANADRLAKARRIRNAAASKAELKGR